MDSDSLDPNVIDELRTTTEDLIRSAASSIPVKVITVVPEIEAWLLAAPELIERAVGEKVSDELEPLAKRDPIGVLKVLASRNHKTWNFDDAIRLLDPKDVERIRALPEVADLIHFLQQRQEEDRAA